MDLAGWGRWAELMARILITGASRGIGRMVASALALALLTMFALPSAGLAQDISSRDPASIAKLMRERGQTVIVTVDEFGDPFIETSANNVDYNIFFYGCTEHSACTSLSLRAQRMSAGRASDEALNGWNTNQRWTKLYSADANSVIMELDLLFAGRPMSEEGFAAYLDIWERSLAQFVRFVDDETYDFVE